MLLWTFYFLWSTVKSFVLNLILMIKLIFGEIPLKKLIPFYKKMQLEKKIFVLKKLTCISCFFYFAALS